MKSDFLGVTVTLGLIASSVAYAQIGLKPPPPRGIVNPYASDCAAGFQKVQVTTDPNGVQTIFHCYSGLIYCPPAPNGYVASGAVDETVPAGKGRVAYKYMCRYDKPGNGPPPPN